MTLKNRLNDDLKDAMRKGEVTKRATIRLMLSALRNEEIAQQKELADDDILQVIKIVIKLKIVLMPLAVDIKKLENFVVL